MRTQYSGDMSEESSGGANCTVSTFAGSWSYSGIFSSRCEKLSGSSAPVFGFLSMPMVPPV